MKPLPQTDDMLFVRTDFSDDATWRMICQEVRESANDYEGRVGKWAAAMNVPAGDLVGKFQAHVDIVDDRDYADLPIEKLLEYVPANHAFFFVVDRETLSNSDHPILVVDLYEERGRSFRAVPSQIQAIENNLSISNMDWNDFASNTDEDGIFRGF